MRKRSKALILIFDYSGLVSDGNLKVLQDSGLDYQFDGNRQRWAIYIRDNSKPNRNLLGFFHYVTGAENLRTGEDYLDMFIKVDEIPEGSKYIENENGIFRNIRFSEMGTIDPIKILFEKEI